MANRAVPTWLPQATRPFISGMEQPAARKQGYWGDVAPKQAVAVFAVFCGCIVVARATYGALVSSGLQPLVQQPGCPKVNAALLASAVDQASAGEACDGTVCSKSPSMLFKAFRHWGRRPPCTSSSSVYTCPTSPTSRFHASDPQASMLRCHKGMQPR